MGKDLSGISAENGGRWAGPGGCREVLLLAVPLILSTGAWAVQQFVDRMFLAWYSPEAIAAAMPAGMLNFTLVSLFLGTVSYVNTFVAQYHGAGRPERIGAVLWQGVYLSLLGGVLVLGLIPLAGPFFGLVGHEAAVRVEEVRYFRMLCWGGFPVIALSGLGGFFTGRGSPWPVMWINLLVTAVNLLLDYLLIFGNWGCPEMGIVGAGLASVVGESVGCVVCVGVLLAPRYRRYRIWKDVRFDRELCGRMLKYGFPSGVQFALEMAGFTFFVLLVGRLGTVELAATNIAFNINNLAFMPMIGCGIAVSVLVGQYLGADDPGLAERSTWSGFILTFGYMGLVAAAYVLVPGVFVAPFAAGGGDFGEIAALTVVLLRFVAAYSLFDTLNIVMASAIKGAGDTRFVMFMSLVLSGGLLVLPTWVAISLGGGIMLCWVIATAYASVLGLAFWLRFRGGRWKQMRVIEAAPAVPPACSECPRSEVQL